MSLLAKVFIVLQTILVMVYLGMTASLYQHRRDWRTSYSKLKHRYSTMVSRSAKEIEALRNFVKAKNELVSAKEREVSFLKTQLDEQIKGKQALATRLVTKTSDFQRELDNNTRLSQRIEQVMRQNEQLNARKSELESDLEKATSRREIAEGQVARLSNLSTQLESDIATLRQSFVETRQKLREKELLIAMAENEGVNFASLLPGPPVPAIDGNVVAVKNDLSPGLVLLSVGADDKVEAGFRFSIYRNNKFVGKVVVERVLRDSAGCRVLFTAEGEEIKAGDSAATRLQ
ncbi:MAG: hypothetical protein AB7N76_34290 [Planctomycetota bacterium]